MKQPAIRKITLTIRRKVQTGCGRYASKQIGSGLCDTEFGTYEGEQGGARHDQHDTAGGLRRVDHQRPQVFDR